MIRINKTTVIGMIALVGISLAGLGCSKVTAENYKQLNSGMTYEEVQKIIGEPANCESTLGFKSCVWEDGDKSISIKFLADSVLLFSKKNL